VECRTAPRQASHTLTLAKIMKMKAVILAVLALLMVIAFRFFVILPENISTGETISSPDGIYRASVMESHSKDFFGKERSWFRFQIVESKTEEIVEQFDTSPIKGPFFGSRSSHKVIFWNDNSSSVEFRFPEVLFTIQVEREKNKEIIKIGSDFYEELRSPNGQILAHVRGMRKVRFLKSVQEWLRFELINYGENKVYFELDLEQHKGDSFKSRPEELITWNSDDRRVEFSFSTGSLLLNNQYANKAVERNAEIAPLTQHPSH